MPMFTITTCLDSCSCAKIANRRVESDCSGVYRPIRVLLGEERPSKEGQCLPAGSVPPRDQLYYCDCLHSGAELQTKQSGVSPGTLPWWRLTGRYAENHRDKDTGLLRRGLAQYLAFSGCPILSSTLLSQPTSLLDTTSFKFESVGVTPSLATSSVAAIELCKVDYLGG